MRADFLSQQLFHNSAEGVPTSHKYGNMGNSMKTTIELPNGLLLEAKRKALETRTTLREIMERALRRELRQTGNQPPRRPRPDSLGNISRWAAARTRHFRPQQNVGMDAERTQP